MEPLDASYATFKSLMPQITSMLSAEDTEADTRLRVIDRVLIEVLGWGRDEIRAEKRSGTGFADYLLTIGGKSRLVLEAKRDNRALGVENRNPGSAYKLSGPVFKDEAAHEGIMQACTYAGIQNCELSCVTNGREWIVFRGNRMGDGTNTLEGMAYVFGGFADLDKKFELFHSLISRQAVETVGYRPYFQEAEGQPIRTAIFSKTLRPQGTARLKPVGDLAHDLDRTMSAFFQQITGDDDSDLVRECFVETSESRVADARIAKIAEELVSQIQPLESGEGAVLRDLIERNQEYKLREFVLIVGTKGSGKSTFIERFFKNVLPRRIAHKCVVVRVDLKTNNGDIRGVPSWLDARLMAAAERSIFPEDPEFTALQGMFYDEYKRLKKGSWNSLYQKDRAQFDVDFGQRIEAMRTSEPSKYLQGLMRHVINSRQALPIFVFDNADHFEIEFQQAVYQYARSLYEESACLVLMPITDRTSWQLSKHGALQSFEHTSLFLPTPQTGEVIRKRIRYLEFRTQPDAKESETGYFVKKGISLSLADIAAFARALQRIFIDTESISTVVGELANFDVRRTLDLIRKTVASPHLGVADLIAAYVSSSAVNLPTFKVERAIIKQGYVAYPIGQNDFVQNLFALDPTLPTSPLLGARILTLLNNVPVREHEGATIDIDQVRAYFAGMGLTGRAVDLWLQVMLSTGLILNYDPTEHDISNVRVLEISPAGRRHLNWATGNLEYLSAMTEVTPILTEATWTKLHRFHNDEWAGRAAKFIEYLLVEDSTYCLVPEHETYEGQKRLRSLLDTSKKRARSIERHRARPAPTR